jgi:hypothetical protein
VIFDLLSLWYGMQQAVVAAVLMNRRTTTAILCCGFHAVSIQPSRGQFAALRLLAQQRVTKLERYLIRTRGRFLSGGSAWTAGVVEQCGYRRSRMVNLLLSVVAVVVVSRKYQQHQ